MIATAPAVLAAAGAVGGVAVVGEIASSIGSTISAVSATVWQTGVAVAGTAAAIGSALNTWTMQIEAANPALTLTIVSLANGFEAGEDSSAPELDDFVNRLGWAINIIGQLADWW